MDILEMVAYGVLIIAIGFFIKKNYWKNNNNNGGSCGNGSCGC